MESSLFKLPPLNVCQVASGSKPKTEVSTDSGTESRNRSSRLKMYTYLLNVLTLYIFLKLDENLPFGDLQMADSLLSDKRHSPAKLLLLRRAVSL